MQQTVFTTIALTGFGIAFFHAAIPTHWLPFVLTARAQNWDRNKTLCVTAVAGGGHVLFTATLGLVVAWLGIALNEKIGSWFSILAGSALIAFGISYIYRQATGKGHRHCQSSHHPGHSHRQDISLVPAAPSPSHTSDRVAITGLLALLTFSPCEAFLPVYVSAARYGWKGFLLLTAILSFATVAAMVFFTILTLAGVRKVNFGFIEKYENGLTGLLLCGVGVLIMLFEK